ncbi:hypothetical protein, partial [Enterococcus casseliflavus]|uniref:hypothetical protein n=1 Tax=Enterococcus casseliflavus TaxID=37734 RepID=UPI003D14905E
MTKVEGELRALMGANVGAPATPPAPPAEPAVPTPPANVPPPPPAATEAPTTFAALMGWIGPRMAAKKLTPDVVAATVAACGVMDA